MEKSIKELQDLVEHLNTADCYIEDVHNHFYSEISMIYRRNKISVANVLSNLSSLSICTNFGRYYAAIEPHDEDGYYFPEEITEELYVSLLKFSKDNPFAKTLDN